MMESAVDRSIKHPEIPIPEAVIEAMPKIVSNMMLRSGDERVKLRASALLLSFMEYNKSLNAPQSQGTTVNVGVKVDNRSDSSRALELIERFRSGQISERTDAGGICDIRASAED